ncbi:tetratricopeptide repeat protein [Aureliella helgolandensis]|nr:tetratricopeptide repeat protein [Aureliella helgolandensis]
MPSPSLDNNSPATRETTTGSAAARLSTGFEAHPRPDRRVRWEWNIPLLIQSVIGLVAAIAIGGGLYYWQSTRITAGLLQRAAAAEVEGDTEQQIQWLTRYIGLAPHDTLALIDLALAVDASVSTPADLDNARRRLSVALAASGELGTLDTQRDLLRQKLIQRLIQLGPQWAQEIEKQVLVLSPPEGDPQATRWLAQSLMLQRSNSEYQKRDPTEFDRQQQYWQWLASQPAGDVLQLALELNPDNVDLAASYLAASQEIPKYFEAFGHTADEAEISAFATRTLERLSQNLDDGRSQVIVYASTLETNRAAAEALLELGVNPALERLTQHHAEVQAQADSDTAAKQDVTGEAALAALSTGAPLTPAGEDSYQPYWDWQIALEGARVMLAAGNFARADEIYSQLLAVDSDSANPQQRETAYYSSGLSLLNSEGIETALKRWLEGIEKLPESLELSSALASGYTSQRQLEPAREWIQKFEQLVESQLDRLDGTFGSRLTTASKRTIRDRLEEAQWNHLLLSAQLALESGDPQSAAQLAHKAFNTPLLLDDEKRVRAGVFLASCYERQQLWDMAGQVLDRCVSISPNEPGLRLAAATAWKNMGATERATNQLSAVDNGSYESALEMARLTVFAEGAKPEGQADSAAIKNAIELARQRFNQLPSEAQAQATPWQLELLELSYLPTNAETPEEVETERLNRLEEIAQKYPTAAELQVLLVSSMTRAGREAAAGSALERLSTQAKATGSAVDQANLGMAQASLLAAQENLDAALATIRETMAANPTQQLRLAKAGADFALRANRPQDAYALLQSVTASELDTSALMSLASIGNSLRSVAEVDQAKLETDIARWTQVLKDQEGPEGTHWRYLAAQQLLGKAQSRPNERERSLADARRLFNEIDARRPRWGKAAALGGQIAAQQGATDEAIRLLQRAIRDGDRQVSTTMVLVRELISRNRLDEAEQEMSRISSSTVQSAAPMSAMAITLAERRGDFSQATEVAKQLSEQRPGELSSWLLVAQTQLAASREPGISAEQKQTAMDQGWAALERANQVSQGKDLRVWDARFKYQLAAGGPKKAEEELALLEQSTLPDAAKLLAASRGYLQLNQLDKARDRVEKAIAMRPNSSESQMVLSEVFSRIGDRTGSLAALRKAQSLDPANSQLREQLALQLAFGETAGDAPSLAEIDKLLSTSDQSSSIRSHLLRAMIDLSQGDEARKQKSIQTLTDLSTTNNPEALDARRLLANHYGKQWQTETTEHKTQAAAKSLAQVQSLYSQLLNSAEPSALDAARYTDWLLKASEQERTAGRDPAAEQLLSEATQTLAKLESLTSSSLASLQLRTRLTLASNAPEQLQTVVGEWVAAAGSPGSPEELRAMELAGRTLAEMDLKKQALVWFEKIYATDPDKYQILVIGLVQADQIDRAVKLSIEGYQRSPSAQTATLIPEVAMLIGKATLPAETEQLLQRAAVDYADSAGFAEAMGTLRLTQERFEEAVAWFQQGEELAPGRVRTLNNLAMAMSEIPMSQAQALAHIERAIELQGRMPELLDTLGTVLYRLKRYDEARKALTEATRHSADSHFQMHLAQVALAQKDLEAAKAAWKKMDLQTIDEQSLSSSDLKLLAELKNRFSETL